MLGVGIFYEYLEILRNCLWNLFQKFSHSFFTYPTFSNQLYMIPEDGKYKIGLLTNEIPPIIYGGVATWIVNFMKMFHIQLVYQGVPTDLDEPMKNLRIKKIQRNGSF